MWPCFKKTNQTWLLIFSSCNSRTPCHLPSSNFVIKGAYVGAPPIPCSSAMKYTRHSLSILSSSQRCCETKRGGRYHISHPELFEGSVRYYYYNNSTTTMMCLPVTLLFTSQIIICIFTPQSALGELIGEFEDMYMFLAMKPIIKKNQ